MLIRDVSLMAHYLISSFDTMCKMNLMNIKFKKIKVIWRN